MAKFEEFSYLWPPRPEVAILPAMLPHYEAKRWWAQTKKNGTCTVIPIAPDGSVVPWNRHAEQLSFHLPKDLLDTFKTIPGWTVLVGETLRGLGVVYLFDILVHKSETLAGVTYRDRYTTLSSLFDWKDAGDHFEATPHLWLAKNLELGFSVAYSGLTQAIDEGLVLKNPDSVLAACRTQKANDGWQVKIRKATKNYGF